MDLDAKVKQYESSFKKSILKVASMTTEYDQFIKDIKDYVGLIKKQLSTSQIRKIYGEIMDAKDIISIKKLQPKLAYLYGRNLDKKYFIGFIDIINNAIEKLDLNGSEEIQNLQIQSLKEFFQTIVAYRKYYGDNK